MGRPLENTQFDTAVMDSIRSGQDFEAGPMPQEATNRARAAIHYAAQRQGAKATTWTETVADGRKVIHFTAFRPAVTGHQLATAS